jgi:dihydroorotate dehydrogenase
MRDAYETFKGEGLKTGAERSLQLLGGVAVGRFMLEHYAGGLHGRIEDPRLAVTVAGIEFDNPLIVGAGWDKKGRAIHGLYHLGFAGVEVGTVPPLGQSGEPQPRLWTIDKHHRVGLNRMGFNSPGKNVIEDNLAAAWPLPCPIGLNVGRNKITPNERAADDHDKVIRQLGDFANYIVLGISSPNTPGLRELQRKEPLTELILRAKDAQPLSLQRRLPVFVKIDPDRTEQELHDIIEAALEAGAAGIVAANTSQREEFKAAYGERWRPERCTQAVPRSVNQDGPAHLRGSRRPARYHRCGRR